MPEKLPAKTIKEKLRQLVEYVDDDVDSLEEAIDYLRWLASDEPEKLAQDEWRRVRKGQAQVARGETVPWQEVKRELGL